MKRKKMMKKTYEKYFYTLFKMLNWIFGHTIFGYLFPQRLLWKRI